MSRISKLFTQPYKMLWAKLYPVSFARFVGVNMKGRIHIYGSSYLMFDTNPWLVTLGDNVHIVDGVRFLCHDGGTLILRHLVADLEITKPITVGDNVYIGMQAIILPGVTIGSNSIIGAGAVVSKNIPPNSVAVGSPAKVIKTLDEYFEKIKKESLHLGHLNGDRKDEELKRFYRINK